MTLLVSVSSDDDFAPVRKRRKKGTSAVTEKKSERRKTQIEDPLPKRATRRKAVDVDTGMSTVNHL